MVRAAGEYVLNQFCISLVKDEFDLINAIKPKAEYSYAVAVVDRIRGQICSQHVDLFPRGCVQRTKKYASLQSQQHELDYGSSPLGV